MTRAVLYRTWRTLIGAAALCAVIGFHVGRSIDRAVTHIGTTGGTP